MSHWIGIFCEHFVSRPHCSSASSSHWWLRWRWSLKQPIIMAMEISGFLPLFQDCCCETCTMKQHWSKLSSQSRDGGGSTNISNPLKRTRTHLLIGNLSYFFQQRLIRLCNDLFLNLPSPCASNVYIYLFIYLFLFYFKFTKYKRILSTIKDLAMQKIIYMLINVN